MNGCTRSTTPCFIENTGRTNETKNAERQTRNCATQVTSEEASSSPGICGGTSTTASSVYLNIVPVRVEENGTEFITKAFWIRDHPPLFAMRSCWNYWKCHEKGLVLPLQRQIRLLIIRRGSKPVYR